MKLRIVAVGKLKDRPTRALVDEYLGRLKHYCPCEEVEVDAKPKKQLVQLRKATDGVTTIALDVIGKSYASKELAQQVERWACRGKGVVAFLIGGAEGLPADVLQSAHARWSLSRLTFPHRLARLLVAEQLYRAMTILRGEPYDH